ncbi:iron export ABC transporter permease subunit FetB [candidate division KSB1 bacterium RBG_16_48_16]|nr:MAG: iron export ABC transporter permease subunit FetB [candidate division KSB1 bacterium RBG_16_48_16]
MGVISLSPYDLAVAASLLLAVAALSYLLRLGNSGQIVVAGVRMTSQLLLLGIVLKSLFAHTNFLWVTLMALVMLAAAAREVTSRQKRRFKGVWGFGIGAVSMFISSFTVTLIALAVIIQNRPWYLPQYAIPLLGMLLGNTMNGIALGLERLTANAWQQKPVIEARLILGQSWNQAIGDVRKECIRSGMIPIVNSMAAAGLVSLPGMMTGQILAGSPPFEAVKYQILIIFLIAAGTGFGTMSAVYSASRRLFDERQRLRLDRLKGQ